MPKPTARTILFLGANPRDTSRLALGEEIREIKDRLRGAPHGADFVVVEESALKRSDLLRVLLQHRPAIVHFSGHAEGGVSPGIYLEDESGRTALVSREALGEVFGALGADIECVLLNACYTAEQAEAIEPRVGCVIGMTGAMPQPAAIAFSRGFYEALGYGRSVEEAYRLGRAQIKIDDLAGADLPEMRSRARFAEEVDAGPAWLEISIRVAGPAIFAAARAPGVANREEPVPATLERLDAFATGAAGAREGDLRALQGEASALHDAFFSAATRALLDVLRARSGGVLIRFATEDPRLRTFPWEALYEPHWDHNFLGLSNRLLPVRALPGAPRSGRRREVRAPVKALALAPSPPPGSLERRRRVVAEAVEEGAFAFLDPDLTGDAAKQPRLTRQLSRDPGLNIVHFIGRGLSRAGTSGLSLADPVKGGEDWIAADLLGDELYGSFTKNLLLFVLEAQEGASEDLLSAGEALGAKGADAVVVQRGPMDAEAAHAAAAVFYEKLTSAGELEGNVAASLNAARRRLRGLGERIFSPVLYLGGDDPRILEVRRRAASPAVSRKAPAPDTSALHPMLARVLGGKFSLLVGEDIGDPEADGRAPLRAALGAQLQKVGDEGGGASLPALMQRLALRSGKRRVSHLFRQSIGEVVNRDPPPTLPLLDALAARTPRGVHATLLWLPLLEEALARHHPDRAVYAIEPPGLGSGEASRILVRRAGKQRWEAASAGELDSFDPEQREAIVVLRLYGGYPADRGEPTDIEARLILTEDDHLRALTRFGDVLPEWCLRWLRNHPTVFAGLSALEWRHRQILLWLFQQSQPPLDSVALLRRGIAPVEAQIWARSAGLPSREAEPLDVVLEAESGLVPGPRGST